MNQASPIRVMIIDDSALIRQLLTRLLSTDPGIEVVGTAPDPVFALAKLDQLQPDVITLDVEMPRMDGLAFLKQLMQTRPTPVLMVSSLTEKGAEVTLDALALGAFDVVTKPRLDISRNMQQLHQELVQKVKAASKQVLKKTSLNDNTKLSTPLPKADLTRVMATEKIIAIGASTGGTEAIREVLTKMPVDAPACVITQHIPPLFSRAFAERMNNMCAITVCEAKANQRILPGHAYIAPGDQHLEIVRSGAQYLCKLHDGPAVNHHKPSVDVLFDSVATAAGRNAVGVLLTGMGADGAKGLLNMKNSGAHTIAQDQATSVVWGMPKEAVKLNAAKTVAPLEQVTSLCLKAF